MEQELRNAISEFQTIPCVKGVLHEDDVQFNFQAAPHTRPHPLREQWGLYVFFDAETCLKVGRTGYSQRFTSHHYGTRRSGSTFAKDIFENRLEFQYEGNEHQIGDWLLNNFGRANLRIPKVGLHGNIDGWTIKFFEAFLHLKLQPRFEGHRPPVLAQ